MSLLSPSSPCWLRRYGRYLHGSNPVVSSGAWEGLRGSVGARHSAVVWPSSRAEAFEPLSGGGSHFTLTGSSFRGTNVFSSTDFLDFLQWELNYEDLMAPVTLLDFMFYSGKETKTSKKARGFEDTLKCFSYVLMSFSSPDVSLH